MRYTKRVYFLTIMLGLGIYFPGSVKAQTENYTEPDTNFVYRNLNDALLNVEFAYRLDLSRRRLDSLPPELFQLKNLRELNLSRNKLEIIPPEISSLSKLEHLDLSNNNLVRLPDEIGQLSQLVYLGLNRNVIETLPATIGSLSNLEVLELWDNELNGVPDEIGDLKKLKVLELRGILFSDEEQAHIDAVVVPTAKIFMSPSCNCKN
ncbi:MAG: leucine-rich repeat domain-containing protein [Bacteroidia bacterium]|nr:leucine-rich repeat domain-containing protein [Bacteroidia bacterium]